jgi:histidyl-tRNA synthetase
MRDLLGADAAAVAAVEQAAYAAAEAAGYQRIVSPIAEESALFERGIGGSTDVVSKELYRLAPHAEDSTPLALRPEATAGILRAYIQHGMRSAPQPVRLVTVAPFFRHDRPQKGRYRQFTQFNVEAIGDAGPGIDIEVIELGASFLVAIGLRDIEVHFNAVGCAACRPAYAAALTAHFAPIEGELGEVDRIRLRENPLRLLDSKDPAAVRRSESAPSLPGHLCADCAAHAAAVRQGLAAIGVTVVDAPRLVRGLDYYARSAWEYLLPGEQGQQGALGGGGRYDGLAELIGGSATPAIGFAIGIDRVVHALQDRGITIGEVVPPSVVVCGIEEGSLAARIGLASTLRTAGISARADVTPRKIGKQLEGAARDAAVAVIIIEPDGRLSLRNMADGKQAEPADEASVLRAVAALLKR